jgi:hypothetical protein
MTERTPGAIYSGLVAADAAVIGMQQEMEQYAAQAGGRAATAEVTKPELEADIG